MDQDVQNMQIIVFPSVKSKAYFYNLLLLFLEVPRSLFSLLPKVIKQFSLHYYYRTIRLIEDSLPKGGRTFKFNVNGIDIFAKGSNWIPAHVLPERVTEEYIYDLLYSAKEAHMNMIRVWGGKQVE